MIDRIQACAVPIARDRVYKSIGFFGVRESLDLGTEVMRMRLYSINAVIGFADHHGKHLTLLPRQGRFGEHCGAIHLHRGFHHAPV